MSAIKRFTEDLAVLAAEALYEECSKIDCYYGKRDYSDIEEDVTEQLFDGDLDDVFEEMLLCVSDFCEDLTKEFPKSFSTLSIMSAISHNEKLKDDWRAIIAAASEPEMFTAMVSAYEEYADMGDLPVSEAKRWLEAQFMDNDYAGMLSDLDYVIEQYELTESKNPKTFYARSIMAAMVC